MKHILFSLLITAVSLSTLAETSTPMISICDRTVEVKLAIMKEIEFTEAAKTKLYSTQDKSHLGRCDRITAEQLGAIETLVIAGRAGNEIASLKTGDFDGLTGLVHLNLSNNALKDLPQGLFKDLSRLKSLDLSLNSLKKIKAHYFTDLVYLQELYLGYNQIVSSDPGALLRNTQITRFVFDGNPGRVSMPASVNDENSPFQTTRMNQARVRHEADRLTRFVRDVWHTPLSLDIRHSSESSTSEAAWLRPLEESLAIQQISEIRDAQYAAAFDFYQVRIEFNHTGNRTAPKSTVFYNDIGKLLEFKISISAEERKNSLKSRVIDRTEILKALGTGFQTARAFPWHQLPSDPMKALKRDFKKLETLDRLTRTAIRSLETVVNAAQERSIRTGGSELFTPSELETARQAQFQTLLHLQLFLNTIARWNAPASDPQFPYASEALLVRAYSARLHLLYRDWFLYIVVGGRPVLNVAEKEFWHRNPIYTLLDTEVPTGTFRIGNRIAKGVPPGSVRMLLKERLTVWFNGWLEKTATEESALFNADFLEDVKITRAALKATALIHEDLTISKFRSWKELWDARIKNALNAPVKSVVAAVADFVGDTRTQDAAPAISDTQMKIMREELQPGDILLERQEFYLSNSLLPGFWKHALIYMGPKEKWSTLRLADGSTLAEDPWIRHQVLPKYRSPWGEAGEVIEAISEGVVFNSLEHAAQKDHIAIIRPVFPGLSDLERENRIAESLKRAINYWGRPYDFDFDFLTDASLVCTELVYRAFHPFIYFSSQKDSVARKPSPTIPGVISVAGRDTMPANEIARLVLYMNAHPEPQTDVFYSGQVMKFVSLYLRDTKGVVQILRDEAGLKALAKTVDQ